MGILNWWNISCLNCTKLNCWKWGMRGNQLFWVEFVVSYGDLQIISGNYASVNSKHQHPPGQTPGEFFKVVKSLPPGRKFLRNYGPGAKKIDKNPAPGDNFVALQDNFAMMVKPFAFFWYSSLAWLSSSFLKIIKVANTKFLSDSSIAQLRFDMYGKN